MSYEDTFVWLRSWCCLACRRIFCGKPVAIVLRTPSKVSRQT